LIYQNLKQFYQYVFGTRGFFVLTLISFFSLVSCQSKLTVTTVGGGKGASSCGKSSSTSICESATSLKFKNGSTSTSKSLVAQWTKSPSSQLSGQKISIFLDEKCTDSKVLTRDYDLGSVTAESYSFDAPLASSYSFSILSVGKTGETIKSDCSSAVSYTPVVSTTVAATPSPSSPATAATTAYAIGQSSLTSTVGLVSGLGGANGILVVGSKLIVGDSGAGRILIWNSFPLASSQLPDVVIGAQSMDVWGGRATGSSINRNAGTTWGLATDGTKLFAADVDGQRVLIWNNIPTTNYQPADVVIGQPDFSTLNSNTTSQEFIPSDVSVCSSKMIVSDGSSHRILIWNAIPTTNYAAADVVIGQTDMISHTNGLTSTKLDLPFGIHCDGTRLIVADQFNNRVLVYNSVPTVSGAAADLVLGQTNFTTQASGTTSSKMRYPARVFSDGTRLIVNDQGNYRVLIWNTFPTSNGQAADLVLGQANFTSGTAPTRSASTITDFGPVVKSGSKLIVGDSDRVLIWNTFPTANNQPADIVLGQQNMTLSGAYNPGPANSLGSETSSFTDGTRLFVSDTGRNRVLIWNDLATAKQQWADIVLGQPNMNVMTANYGGISASSLSSPKGIYSDGTKLYVADNGNNRVLVWNTLPTSNNQSADFVLGKGNFTTSTTDLTASLMAQPHSILVYNNKLLVSEAYNSRILIWNNVPTTTGQTADVVVGPADFVTRTQGCSQSLMNNPNQFVVTGGKLIVSDRVNNRVLIWNSIPTTNGVAANVALGQANVTSCTGSSGVTLSSTYGVAVNGSKLYVSDGGGARILVWNNIPTVTEQQPDAVYGQSSLSSFSYSCNAGYLSGATLCGPGGLTFWNNRLFISDSSNYRILSIDAP
jgi:hypothetical protein